MKKIIFYIFVLLFLSFTFDLNYSIAQSNNPESTTEEVQPPTQQGGVRLIIPEEDLSTKPEDVIEDKSERSVLFGLGAVFLVIIAVVAAIFFLGLAKTNATKFQKEDSNDHKKL